MPQTGGATVWISFAGSLSLYAYLPDAEGLIIVEKSPDNTDI